MASISETYLSGFVKAARQIDIYTIMWSAGQIEQMLGLSGHTKFDAPRGRPS